MFYQKFKKISCISCIVSRTGTTYYRRNENHNQFYLLTSNLLVCHHSDKLRGWGSFMIRMLETGASTTPHAPFNDPTPS